MERKIAGIAIIAVIAGGIFMLTGNDAPPEINTPSQNQTAESKTSEPEKNIMEEIIARLESYEGTKDFMTAKSLVSFDISASRRKLPEALIDRNRIINELKNILGDIQPQNHDKGFTLRPDRKKLPLDEWRRKKAEIFTAVTPENLKPAKSLQHDRLINALKSSGVKEGWLTLYFMTDNENVRLAASVNVSGNTSPILRLEGELIPTYEGVNMAAKISENGMVSGYRIIFEVSEKFKEGKNDFDSLMSEYISQYGKGND